MPAKAKHQKSVAPVIDSTIVELQERLDEKDQEIEDLKRKLKTIESYASALADHIKF